MNIKFPDNSEQDLAPGKPVVILGANGSGKTRFGVRIEELNDNHFRGVTTTSTSTSVQRISAQKSLSISETLTIRGLEASKRDAFLGSTQAGASKHGYRYSNNPSTHLLNDYDKALALLFAKNNAQLERQREKEKSEINNGKERSFLSESLTEQVQKIWHSLLPKRKLDLSGNDVHTIYKEEKYHGRQMSDGERVVLYMIVQALIVEENTIIIIDEPELHIHKAILNKLWNLLESKRQDCVFVYITHDIDFAVSRNSDKIIWIKSYDGKSQWEYEFLSLENYTDIPQNLLFEIIGTQKKIVFVEGTKNSLDYLLYQEVYKDKEYHVIPCGGCSQVINYVKAKNGYSDLNSISICGVIDRDFRLTHEIEALGSDNIYFLNVAEVENLFIVPELLDIMCKQLCSEQDKSIAAKNFVVKLYKDIKHQQINDSFIKEINFQMAIFNSGDAKVTPEEIKSNIDKRFTLEYINDVLTSKEAIFYDTDDLLYILKVFNYKELSKKIGHFFGIKDSEYTTKVINLLRFGDNAIKEKIITALKVYVPELP